MATYEYDVFGALRAQTGPADTVFRYTGEQWDRETGFCYLLATSRRSGPSANQITPLAH